MTAHSFVVVHDEPKPAQQARSSGLEVVCMADVKPSAIDWLWPNWIALGKVHVLAGEGGRGKSTILCNTTAITTTGAKWPDGADASQVGSVMILAAEDDVEDTLLRGSWPPVPIYRASLSFALCSTRTGVAVSTCRPTSNGSKPRL